MGDGLRLAGLILEKNVATILQIASRGRDVQSRRRNQELNIFGSSSVTQLAEIQQGAKRYSIESD